MKIVVGTILSMYGISYMLGNFIVLLQEHSSLFYIPWNKYLIISLVMLALIGSVSRLAKIE